ncbi:hypothetical protein JHK85_008001 [Glycine max]|uniref:Uncharacterized protein n=2 Tax=Glycine subgen. Soja TaxID=1462606 RepID=A0A0R0KVW5_SOYBN|nr:hypothetical protein JHK87_007619 [Glycine soja]KAG5055491.1 hypothetical protein JHK85_008001 [Glycine max]KAG5072557.1 hypothetical protein JHK86_007768 [Glycine max]KAH1070510.1 hypothetical protein GYH30_007538 [Glycine max]RZC21177.1 hypothetical protein D0Y65_007454 [Glycine soja]
MISMSMTLTHEDLFGWCFLLLLLLKLPGPVEYSTVQDEKKTTNQFSEYVNVSRTNQSSCKTSIYRCKQLRILRM